MTTSDVVSTGAMLVMVLVVLVLLIQYLKLQDIWQIIVDCKAAKRWAKIREMENRELRSALRAEKQQVDELQKKIERLREVIPSR